MRYQSLTALKLMRLGTLDPARPLRTGYSSLTAQEDPAGRGGWPRQACGYFIINIATLPGAGLSAPTAQCCTAGPTKGQSALMACFSNLPAWMW